MARKKRSEYLVMSYHLEEFSESYGDVLTPADLEAITTTRILLSRVGFALMADRAHERLEGLLAPEPPCSEDDFRQWLEGIGR